MTNFLPPRPIREGEQFTDVNVRFFGSDIEYLTGLALLDQVTPGDEMRGAVDSYLAINGREFIVRTIERQLKGQGAFFPVKFQLENASLEQVKAIASDDDRAAADHLRFAVKYYVACRQNDPNLEYAVDSRISDISQPK